MTPQLTSKQYLFQLNLIYGAQVFFMLAFAVAAFVISQSTQPDLRFATLLIYVLGAILIAALSGAHFIFNMMIKRIEPNFSLRTKLQKYLTASLVRSALLEFPGLFGSVVCILTGTQLPLMAVLFILIVFVMLRPSAAQIIRDLNLSPTEKVSLENPQSTLGE